MEKGSDGLRERLLARLPQPENVAAYREEVASMLAKHNKGLTAEKWSNYILGACVVWLLAVSNSTWGPNLDSTAQHVLQVFAAVFFFLLGVGSLKVYNHRNQMEVLKEVKQVQLQVLELQASLRKDGAE
ncbi:MAG: hypothetical protein ABSF28_12920 [Terracidiphilus sp.]